MGAIGRENRWRKIRKLEIRQVECTKKSWEIS